MSKPSRNFESSATMPILSTPTSRRSGSLRTSQLAYGQPWVWLFGGTLVVCLAMIIGLLILILSNGLPTFWPKPIVAITTLSDKKWMGEIVREDEYQPDAVALKALPENVKAAAEKLLAERKGQSHRELIKVGNYELTQTHHRWVSDFEIQQREYPEWALILEREGNQGRFYGILTQFLKDDKPTADTPAAAWTEYQQHHGEIDKLVRQIKSLETHDIGKLSHRKREADFHAVNQEMRYGKGSPQHLAALDELKVISMEAQAEQDTINTRINELQKQARVYALQLKTFDGIDKTVNLADIVRAYPANQLSTGQKWGIYFSRWAEFIGDDPRNSNTEGGVFPCIWGTLAMTLIMTIIVVPFGVLAALYLREYAKPGILVTTIRIAVNNLAGVPSIVFGVFGFGFFCYFLGGSIDQLFFPASKQFGPVYGTGGIMWAGLTLALLTVPVVIVATEEALASVSSSMREGSYACGASKWQTIWRIVLPRAMPGILTGTILAMARGAGEVAPMMLVGAMKIAPDLPIDGVFPYLHLERSFMHLGFHIYDVGFQSPDSEAAKPMVFTTTLLLILLIALLNLSAMWLRNRLRKKYLASAF
jgi:phosphate transport system permease protein